MIFPIVPQFKQRLGLMCPADEIFLGGSLGGGKTLYIVLKAMKLGLEHKRLNVFIFRQTFEELKKSVIPEFIDKVPPVLFRYKSSERCGVLPNGSRIFFCYLENEADLARYQSTNMDVLIMDECTHNPEAYVVKLKRRNRCARKDFKAKSIFTGNPGGASHNYFKRRFIDNKEPYKIYVTEETKHLPKEQQITQCFIPAGLIDNVDLVKQDPSYVGRLLEMPEKDKEMYLYGNWDINAGQFFSEFVESKHVIDSEVQIKSDSTVILGMDWGTAKPSAVIFCKVNEDSSVIAYKEIYTMRSGEPDCGTNQNASEVADLIADSITEEEKNQIKYMVLDTACWQDHGNGRTIASIIRDTLKERHINIQIIEASKARADGWQQMRWYLHKEVTKGIPFLRIHKNCKNLLRTLPDLVHDENKAGDLNSKQEDHCFVAGTKITTKNGLKNIENLTIKDLVLTRDGYKKIESIGKTQQNANVFTYTINNTMVTCTNNHPFYINNSFSRIDTLRYHDIIEVEDKNNEVYKWIKTTQSNLMGLDTIKQIIITSAILLTVKKVMDDYIRMCINIIMEKSLKDAKFITSTLIASTMIYQILWLFKNENINNYTCGEILQMKNMLKELKNILTELDHSLKNGMQVRMEELGTQNMVKELWQTQKILSKLVKYVVKNTQQKNIVTLVLDFAQTLVSQNLEDKVEKIIPQEYVLYVEKVLQQIDTQKNKLAVPTVVYSLDSKYEGKTSVYNLSVKEKPEYFANGILVHNCEDALRYILKKMPKPIDYRSTPEDKITWGVPATYPKIVKE